MFSPTPRTRQTLKKLHARQQENQKADALEVVATSGVAITAETLADALLSLPGATEGATLTIVGGVVTWV